MGFSRQEYWSGLPCPAPGDIPTPGIKPASPVAPAFQADSLPLNQSYYSVQFSCSVVSNSMWPHESQHARPPCPSPTPKVYSNSCPSSWWCHPAISSSVVPFSWPQSLPASGSFPISQLLAWGGQSIGAFPFSRGSSQPRNLTGVSCIGRWILIHGATRKTLTSFFIFEESL